MQIYIYFFKNILKKNMSDIDLINDQTKKIIKSLKNKDKKEKKEKEIDIKKFSKKIGDYVLLGEIGTGTFSKVSKAFHLITEQEVAVKILQKDKIKDNIDIERILREIEILKKVIHPNICQLYETFLFNDGTHTRRRFIRFYIR